MSIEKRKFSDLFRKWGLTSIKLNIHFAELEFSPTDDDQIAAWDMYVELITRITTQPLKNDEGDEATALESVHSLFAITRNILKEKGKNAVFQNEDECLIFRNELSVLQNELIKYTKLLADLAMVEDLTVIIENDEQE